MIKRISKEEMMELRRKHGLKGLAVNFELVKDVIDSKNGEIENWDSLDKIFIKCKECGHKWRTSWNVIQSGHWCLKCARRKYDAQRALENNYEEEVRKLVADKSGTLDSDWTYTNNHEKFWVTCKRSHRWSISWNNLKKSWCPYCNKHNVDVKDIVKFIENKGGVLPKDWKFISSKEKFDLKCKKGHHFRSCWDKIRADHWCPYCVNTKTEAEFRKVMEGIFSVTFLKQRPKWLRNPLTGKLLELDGYNETMKIAFEYQGPHHYDSPWLAKMRDLEYQRKKDSIKVQKCLNRGIALIVMPHWIPKKDWKMEIMNQCYSQNLLIII